MLTAEQKKIRRGYVCSSEIAAIVGVDQYTQISKVFYNKRPDLLGLDADAIDAADVSNPEMDAVNHLDKFIINTARKLIGPHRVVNPQKWVVASDGICAATLDALVDDKLIIEAKTAGLARMYGKNLPDLIRTVESLDEYRTLCSAIKTGTDWYAPEFGPGMFEIPKKYYLQTQFKMYCAGINFAVVAACVAGRGHCEYEFGRDDKVIDILVKAAHNFMTHVKNGVAPDGAPPMEFVKLRKREPGKIITFGDDKITLYTEYHRLKLEADDLAKLADDAKSAIIAELGDAEIGQFPNGANVTYKEQTATRIDAALLRKNHPEVAEAVTKTTVSRVARITEPKQERDHEIY